MIAVVCPHCRELHPVLPSHDGRWIRCSDCHGRFMVDLLGHDQPEPEEQTEPEATEEGRADYSATEEVAEAKPDRLAPGKITEIATRIFVLCILVVGAAMFYGLMVSWWANGLIHPVIR